MHSGRRQYSKLHRGQICLVSQQHRTYTKDTNGWKTSHDILTIPSKSHFCPQAFAVSPDYKTDQTDSPPSICSKSTGNKCVMQTLHSRASTSEHAHTHTHLFFSYYLIILMEGSKVTSRQRSLPLTTKHIILRNFPSMWWQHLTLDETLTQIKDTLPVSFLTEKGGVQQVTTGYNTDILTK